METPIPAWTPPENVRNHAGTPITPDQIFFAAPPATIGPVITAASSLSSEPKSRTLLQKFGSPFLAAVGIGFATWVVVFMVSFTGLSISPALMTVIVLVVAIAAGAWFYYEGEIFRAECSYVGQLGIARYTLKGSPTANPTTMVMHFADAVDLRTTQTRTYKNGQYQYTSYRYVWKQRNQPNQTLAGAHTSESGQPPVLHPYYLATSAEISWTQYLLKLANQDLAEKGYIEFPLQGNLQAVKVGNNFLEFVTKQGDSQRTAVADMQNVELRAGHFKFKHRDAKWWSGKGKYSFAYSNMPNAKLFLLCLQQLAGVRFGT
ncbi:MAG: hypothetical protein AAFW84_25175 [Cyanobacteria bacterium J06635_15]